MSTRVGFFGGVLALSALDALVSTQGATGRVTGAFGGLAKIVQHLADPAVPAIPDLRPGASSGTPTSHTTTGHRRHLTTV